MTRAPRRESMLIGSQNASITSLTRNRELGILLTRADGGGDAITTASATFDSDFGHALELDAAETQADLDPSPHANVNADQLLPEDELRQLLRARRVLLERRPRDEWSRRRRRGHHLRKQKRLALGTAVGSASAAKTARQAR